MSLKASQKRVVRYQHAGFFPVLKREIVSNCIMLACLEQPMRAMPDGSSNATANRSSPVLVRASSFESIHTTNDERQSPTVLVGNEEERKRQAKLRSRACNDSFRQAVDKSYCQNTNDEGETRRPFLV